MKGTSWLRQQNEKRTLSYLRSHPVCTRLDIGKALGVSKNTVSLIVDKFIEEGVIRETGIEEQGSVGRPRKQLRLIPSVYKSIGLFIQRSTGQYVVTDYSSTIVAEGEFPLSTECVDTSLSELVDVCRELLEHHPEVLGVGLGIPGLVDPVNGVVHYSSHLGWRQVDVRHRLESSLEIPVKVLNSVKASALAPMNLVLDGPIHSAFYIRIDKGVGGALVIGNELFHGISSTAGEIGHFVVQPDGPLCTCGQKGCLEALVSVPNLVRDINQGSSLTDLIAQGKGEHLFGERGALLGTAISQIIHLFNPEYIIIDTPLQLSSSFKKGTLQAIQEHTLQYPFGQTKVVFVHAQFGAAIGSALAIIIDFEQDTLRFAENLK